MTIATEPSIKKLRSIVNLADHYLRQADDMEKALHERLGTAVEDALEWLDALETLPPAGHVALAEAVFLKHGATTTKLPFAISKILSLSTAHLEQETANALQSGLCFGQTVYDKEMYGWWIALHDLSDPPETVESPSLQAVIMRAKSLGCERVMLDSDAEILEDLPCYDW